jgi:tRNA pseudouridine55 synthase
VDAVVRALDTRRAGHAGTLDPFARGLLLIAWGRATGLVPYLQEYPKTYLARVRFGRVTDTQDRTGRVLAETDPARVTEERIRAALSRFRGPILQTPPMYSALKRDGQRLYRWARQGKEVSRNRRRRFVERFELMDYRSPLASFEIVCSKGTYVRTLAHDLGQVLGPGACVEDLSRTRIGPYAVEEALPAGCIPGLDATGLAARAVPPALALPDWPAVTVPEEEARAVAHGSWRDPAGRAKRPTTYRVMDEAGELLALVRGGERVELLRVLAEGPR